MEHLRKPLDNMSLELFNAARQLNVPEANVIICPFIVTAATTMIYYATEHTSSPYRQLERVLQYDQLFSGHSNPTNDVLMAFREAILTFNKNNNRSQSEPDNSAARNFTLIFGSKIFIQTGAPVKQEFLDKITKNLKIEAGYYDFANDTAGWHRHVEQWLGKSDDDRFDASLPPNMVDPFYKGARMVIGNAAHFRGGWAVPFDVSETQWGLFHLESGKSKYVPMMHMTDRFPFGEDVERGFKYVELPYLNNDACMVLTISTKKRSFAAFVEAVGKHCTDLSMRKQMKTVKLALPRFTVMNTYDFKTLLNLVGIKEVFGDDANFGNMTDEKTFRLSEGFHKSAIQVDEHGTFANEKNPPPLPNHPDDPSTAPVDDSAGSKRKLFGGLKAMSVSKSVDSKAAEHKMDEFIADQPFMFSVRHNRSSAYLFSGCIMSP